MPKKLSELPPALQQEAQRLLADPALVAEWQRFIERHDGSLWLRDLDGTLSPAEKQMA